MNEGQKFSHSLVVLWLLSATATVAARSSCHCLLLLHFQLVNAHGVNNHRRAARQSCFIAIKLITLDENRYLCLRLFSFIKTMSYFNHTYIGNYGGGKPCVYRNGQYFVQCNGQVNILITTYNTYCKIYWNRNGDSQTNWCGCGTGMKFVHALGSELVTNMLNFRNQKANNWINTVKRIFLRANRSFNVVILPGSFWNGVSKPMSPNQ